MDNIPPLNLSTSIKIQESQEANSEVVEELNHQDEKAGENYMFVQYGLSSLENVITITGEPVSDSSKNDEARGHLNISSNQSAKADTSVSHENQQPHSTNTTVYQCSSCSKSFVRASQLRHHEKLHTIDKDPCSLRNSNEFEEDQISIYKIDNFGPDAEKDAKVSMSHVDHLKKTGNKLSDDKKFKCPLCPMSFLREVYLTTHIRKHTGEEPYECEVCKSRFKQMSHLTTHLRTHTLDRPYSCNLCPASFSQTGSLRRHLRSHTGERPFKCDQCDAVFVEKRNLSRHKLSHSGERPYKCDICTGSFTQLIDLKRHKLSHFGIKPFKCELCGASFSRKNNLRWHKLTHEGNTPYKCHVCNVGFRVARDLKSHKRCHSDAKTFYCGHCEIDFSHLNTFKRHMTIHNTDESLVCNLCGETFPNQTALFRHIKKHGIEKKFSCDQCPMSFTHLNPLKKHKVVVHSESKVDRPLKQEGKEVNATNHENDMKEGPEIDPQQVMQVELTSPKVSATPTYQSSKKPIEAPSYEPGLSLYVNQQETSSNGDRSLQQTTLVLTQPGLPPRTGKPAGNCQNHNSHVHTMAEGVYDQWQVWCFCENGDAPPVSANIASNTTVVPPSTPSNSCSSPNNVLSSSTPMASTTSDVHVQTQVIDQGTYSNATAGYGTNVNHYISNRSSIASKESVQSDRTSANKLKPNFAGINDSLESPIKSEDGKNLQMECSSIQSTSLQENSMREFLLNNLPVALNDSNSGIDEISNSDVNLRSGFGTLSKKDYILNKNFTKDRHIIESDNNSITAFQNVPSTTNSIVESNSEKHIQDKSFGTQNKMSLPKNYLSQTIDDKMFMNTEFSSDFLADDLASKSLPAESSLPGVGDVLPKESKKSYGNDELQAFETVFPEYASDVCSEKMLPLQYCLTVNNPATGEIQIESDLFSSKQGQPVSPIKKRKLPAENESEFSEKICPFCSKVFTKESSYHYHLKRHTEGKLLVCGICNQSFSHKNSLIVHMRNHTGERPYVCALCNAGFSQKSNLRVHTRTHTGERPYRCNLCEASFSQGSHLKAHKRIHFNHRPFVCQTCEHAFTQKSALTRHVGKHSNKRNLKCVKCQITFTSRELFKKHVASHKEKQLTVDGGEPKRKNMKVSECEKMDSILTKVDNTTESKPSSPSTVKETSDDTPSKEINSPDPEADLSKVKHRPAILHPTRRSRRILESASKKTSNIDSDFITGDLDEIDRAEEMENQLVAMKAPRYRKKPNSAEVVKSWCFCEVAHGPNEPHSHSHHEALSVIESSQDKSAIPTTISESPCEPSTDTVYQLSIPNISQSIVLQGTQNRNNTLSISNEEVILQSGVAEHREIPMTISSSTSHFNESDFPTLNVNGDQRILRREDTGLFGTGPVISQVFTTSQLVTSEGNTLYTIQPEVLNAEAVVLNAPAGTIFFDVSSDGQMLTLPMQDPIVVGAANAVENTISLSGTDSADLSEITPVSLSLPIGSLQQQHAEDSVGSQNASQTSSFTGNQIDTDVDFVPIGGNFIELFNEPNENINFESLKGNVSPRAPIKRNRPQSVVVVPSKCSLCSRKFAQKSTLYQHVKEEHAGSHCCNFCCEVFPTAEELTTHKEQHSPENLCSECNSAFDSKTQLNRHRAQVHRVTKTKKDVVNCEPCGAKFTQLSDFKRHMQSHLGIKPYLCNQCNASFTRKSSLNKHERIHTGERPYICTHCNKSFSYRYQFNRHSTTPCTFLE